MSGVLKLESSSPEWPIKQLNADLATKNEI